MPIMTPKILLYHIPKCGGKWAKEALRRGLYHPETDYGGRPKTSGERNSLGLYREHAIPAGIHESEKRGRLSVCFVRHPVAWYRSFWCFRIKSKSYDKNFPLDDMMDDNYENFINDVLDAYPNGFVTQLFQNYTGKDLSNINFVGKQEQLADDLVEALTISGQEFDEGRLRRTKMINVYGASPEYDDATVLSEGAKTRLFEAEEWVINTFYNDV